MRRAPTIALALPLLFGGSSARGEIEVGLGPNLQLASSSRADATVGTGFVLRGLDSVSASNAFGLALESLWLVPTGTPGAGIASQQDLLFMSRLRPPVGRQESLAIDLGAGLTRYAGGRPTFHPTIQIGASLCGRLGARWSFEIGARFAMTPNLFYRGADGMFEVPSAFVMRFGGMLVARL